MSKVPLCQEITERLQREFSPDHINVIDESHLHIGHAGAPAGGESHFKVEISIEPFKDYPRVYRHQQIYGVLEDLMKEKIHALSIDFID